MSRCIGLCCFIGIILAVSGTEASGTTTPIPTPSSWFQCPGDGYFRNPYDCQEYFHCSNDLAWLLRCPHNLQFNEEKNVCDQPSVVRCEPEVTTPSIPIHRHGLAKEGVSELDDPIPNPTPSTWFHCPGDGYYKNPYNCQEYFECFHGNAWLLKCPANLQYNEDKQVCDYPSVVNCQPVVTGSPRFLAGQSLVREEDTTTGDVDETSTTPDHSTTEQDLTTPKSSTPGQDLTTTTPRPTPSPWFQCPGDGYYRNPYDCQEYFLCTNGYAWLMRCPHNLQFNEEKNVCDQPGNVNCVPKVTTPSAIV